MIKRLLIANRGEIACRIIRTAKRLGIETIAIYSTIDERAQHVIQSDEAYCIGGASAKDSYLQAEAILQLALQVHADAIHPGYGFLSENAEFSRACDNAGVIFVGPSGDAIQAMGSKSRAKAIMQAAGVPVVPGYHGEDQTEVALQAAADEIGYPVLLKAAAGGGGKGMRRVDSAEDFSEALAAARRESQASFGDDHMLIEKCLLTPRHIEVQLLCDQFGHGIYIGDRDCSVQRRHQKIIEEAPAPGLSDDTRRAMGDAAVAAAKAIDYSGVGTIEFLYEDGEFYFMEMNTRLQVEHPVTEAISGVDLVEMQLQVAAGMPLSMQQTDVVLQGHAIELRVYAEDVEQDFLPAAGQLKVYQEPSSIEGLRIDSGVVEGDEISAFYDPMIAKIIGMAPSRRAALALTKQAAANFQIEGIKHNLDFLYRVLADEHFVSSHFSTAFLSERLDTIMSWQEVIPPSALVALFEILSPASATPWFSRPYWRLNLPLQGQYQFDNGAWHVEQSAESWCLSSGDQNFIVQAKRDGNHLLVNVEGRQYRYLVTTFNEGWRVFGGVSSAVVRRPLPTWMTHDAADDGALLAPMNGRVITCSVEAGQWVEKGSTLMIMEAMKMEYAIKAPFDGVVESFLAGVDELVEGGQLLINFVADEVVV